MRNLKDSLGRGPERLKHRKERHRLQGAIEALEYYNPPVEGTAPERPDIPADDVTDGSPELTE